MIKPADKGGALIIMDSNKYNEACLQQLTDNEYYEEIEHDPNTEYRQVIDSTIDKMSAADLITDFEFRFEILSTNSEMRTVQLL